MNEVEEFLCTLEGAKTRIKNLHWSAPSMDTHKELDVIGKIVSDFQDDIAEQYMGIKMEKFELNFLEGKFPKVECAIDMLSKLFTATVEFYKTIENKYSYLGIKSACDDFIGGIKKEMGLIKNYCDNNY